MDQERLNIEMQALAIEVMCSWQKRIKIVLDSGSIEEILQITTAYMMFMGTMKPDIAKNA